MSRAVDGTKHKDRRNKILKLAKGYYGRRSTNYRTAKDAVRGQYAYRGRKERKDFRRLWMPVAGGSAGPGLNYSPTAELNIEINQGVSNMAITAATCPFAQVKVALK